MTRRRAKVSDRPTGAGKPAAPADSPARPDDLPGLLARHCRSLGADGGAILRVARDGRVDILAVCPPPEKGAEPPAWLREALVSADEVLAGGSITTKGLHEPEELYGQQARRHLVMAPAPGGGAARGLVAFVKETADPDALAGDVRRMEMRVPALHLYGLHVTAGETRGASPRLAPAMASLTAVNEHDRFLAAAMAFCNELASRWCCERVSLGFLKAHYVELGAMSHTEKFSRKMQAVQLIEAAMEECLDQDVEIACPAGDEADFVNRDARELSARGGRTAVLSLPLRQAGRAAAVVTLERALDNPFDAEEIESLRLTCELCATRLVDLRKRDRWIGAKAAEGARRGLGALIGPRYTWMKLLVVLLAGGGLYAGLATGEYRIEAPFVLEAARRQVLPAPFDGEIEDVHAAIGDEVRPGQVLGKLKTVTLERQANAARAELFEYRKQADAARGEKKWAQAQMAAAKARQLTEEIQLLTERIEKGSIKALIAGTVVAGDLERFVGASVEKGQVLFEIAPIRSLRAELSVPEDQIADLLAARRDGEVGGRLAAASYPQERIDFVVDRIHPMAEEVDDQAAFEVRAKLARTCDWMRPGMEGIAHVSLGRRRLAWLWSRRLVNWLRLWLWL